MLHRRFLIAFVVFVIGCVNKAPTLHAEPSLTGQIHLTDVMGGQDPLIAASRYQLWMPEDTSVVRTIFVINMRAAGKRVFFRDPLWRQMAARHSAAMMYCEFESKSVRENGYGASMLKACDQFADSLDRPELRHAPFVLWGHSMGGRVVQDFVRFLPERVLTFHIALRAHPTPPEQMEEGAEATRVPGLYLMGERDGKPSDIREHFNRARRLGAPRAWVWLPGQSHWPKGMNFDQDKTSKSEWKAWAAHEVVIPWTEAMIEMRMPDDADPRREPVVLRPIDTRRGWYGDIQSGTLNPIDPSRDEGRTGSWFPNHAVAKAWMDFSRPWSR
ncbi:MAG: hypothetical protein AAGC97_16715 [Planctomycetota bacterium]